MVDICTPDMKHHMDCLRVVAVSLAACCANVGLGVDGIYPTDLNVVDFGAKGDGVTDDSDAIQKAATQAADRNWCHMKGIARRFNKGRSDDGPHLRIVFPEGRYLVKKPIFFRREPQLFGFGKATIVGGSPTTDVFVVISGVRSQVNGLTFEGGRRQILEDTFNIESANVKIRDCVFRNSSAAAIESRVYRHPDEKGELVTIGNYRCDKGWTNWREDVRIDSPLRQSFNNSTLMMIERCFFKDCAQAANFGCDGGMMREVSVETCVTTGSVFSINGAVHAYALDVRAKRVGKSDLCVFSSCGHGVSYGGQAAFLIEHSRFRTLDGTGMCLLRSDAGCDYTGSQVTIRDLETESGGCPEGAIVRCLNGKSPEILVITGVRDTSGRPVKAVAYGPGITMSDFDANRHYRHMPSDLTYSIAIGNNSTNVDESLPDCCAPFVEPASSITSPNPLVVKTPRPIRGTMLWACDHGLSQGMTADDTAAMQRVFAAARAVSNAVVVLPPRWITITNTIDISGEIAVVGAGTAAIRVPNETTDVFRVADGAKVVLANLLIDGGRHHVSFSADEARGASILVDRCFTYEAAGAAFAIDVVRHPERVRFAIDGGVHYHTLLYDGNADAVINATWFRCLPPVPLDEPLTDSVSVINRGRMLYQNVLGVPVVFSRYPHSGTNRQIPKHDYRWIDNRGGKLRARHNRFGAEWGGICPVFNFNGGQVTIESGNAYYYPLFVPHGAVVTDEPTGEGLKMFGVLCPMETMYLPRIEFAYREKPGAELKPTTKQDIHAIRPRQRKKEEKRSEPLIMLRQSDVTTEDHEAMEKILEIHGRHPGSVDETWLAISGWLDADGVREKARTARKLHVAAESAGVSLGLQQGMTLGHGNALSASWSGSSAGTRMWGFSDDAYAVGRAGERLSYLCARSPEVHRYEEEYVAAVCEELKPTAIWLDDDLRISVWKPDGCFCRRCLDAFACETGERLTREELVGRLFSGREADPIRSKWFAFNSRSLAQFAAAARRGADRVRSNCRLSLQVVNSSMYYSGLDLKPVLLALSGNGRCAVGVRAGEGCHNEEDPRAMLGCFFDVMREAERCRAIGGWIGPICNEGENFTRQVLNKSCEAVLKESALTLAAGCDAISVYWYDARRPEPLSYQEELAAGLAAWRPYFERLAEVSRRTRPGGVAKKLPDDFADRLPPTMVGRVLDNATKSYAKEFTRSVWNPCDVVTWGIPVVPPEAEPCAFYEDADLARLVPKGMSAPTTDELERFRDELDRRAGGGLPVRLGKTHALVVYPRIDPAGQVVAISFYNVSLGRTTGMPVYVRNPAGARLTLMRGGMTDEMPIDSRCSEDENERTFVLPDLEAYGVLTVFCRAIDR